MTAYSQVLSSVLLPAYDRLKGRDYVKRRRFLEDSQWWPAERVRQFQWDEARRLLTHAFETVPYLRVKYHAAGIRSEDVTSLDDFSRLPPLTREEINQHREELCSTGYRGRLLPHATGGSSGTPTRFYRTLESYDWRVAAKDRAYEWSGWRAGERSVYLWGAPVGKQTGRAMMKMRAYERLHRQVVINTFAQTSELWEGVHDTIHAFKPVLVVGYVSSLEGFAAFLQARRLTLPPLRAVIGAAEPLFASARAAIESAFGAPAFNTYGSREFMSIAAECAEHRGLHIHSENLLVETQDEAEASEILVTDLHNYGMPFIRYAIGDVGTITHASCPCGRGLPRLESIEGRVLDVLRSANGRTVPGEFFPHLLKDVPEFAQFRVEQRTLEEIVITAVMTQPLSEKSRGLLEHEIGKVFGTATQISILPVDEIPPLKSGKRRVTIGLEV